VKGRRTSERFFLVLLSGGAIGGPEDTSLEGGRKGGPPEGQKWYGFGVSIDKCIGCAAVHGCVQDENNVPGSRFLPDVGRAVHHEEERNHDGQGDRANAEALPRTASDKSILRSYFVAKLCNQCRKPPCVQVCPVGQRSDEGRGRAVNEKTCIGCRYCIQACPYGARTSTGFPHRHKCTFCYHRTSRGLCPLRRGVPDQARIFGD